MAMLQIRYANVSAEGAKLLRDKLRELGHRVHGEQGLRQRNLRADALLCYGYGQQRSMIPSLNINCSRSNKLQQLEAQRTSGVRTVSFASVFERGIQYPAFGRSLMHIGGTDVINVPSASVARRLLEARRIDYLTSFVDSDREFRLWIYRGRRIRTYEKMLHRPENQHGPVRSYDNGWDLVPIDGGRLPRDFTTQAALAVRALNLDFGAVDMLQGVDGLAYVLEVNSAPGYAEAGAQALADRVDFWARNNYPQQEVR